MALSSPLPARVVTLDGRTSLEIAQISDRSQVREVLVSLDASSCQVVLVVDENARVVGLLTDGDVRRALLRGAGLTDPVRDIMRTEFTYVGPGARRADVLDAMQARRISEVPVLDADRRLIGLHLLHDVVGPKRRPNRALIMAGGRGTRLAPITDSMPKPMVRVAGRPILERIVHHLVGVGIRHIFISVHYLGHIIEDYFGDGDRFGCRIEYLREEKPLGTAGALSLLPRPVEHPVLVMNGDLVTQADVGAFLDFHETTNGDATMAVRRYLHSVPFGCVELDGRRVVGLDEKPTLEKTVNAGLYVVAPSLVTAVASDTPLTMPELISQAMANGRGVSAWEILDDWLDVGQHEQLERARGER